MKFKNHVWDWGQKTYVMGILNVTPDSFSDGGQYNQVEQATLHALKMIEDGADIIDIGGESTRPSYIPITEEEEINRVVPVISAIRKKTSHPISIDTYRASTAKFALEAGADIVNDIWGLQRDCKMAEVVAEYDAPVIIMHNKNDTNYDGDIIQNMRQFLYKSIKIAHDSGVKDDKIILDIGIGFGKTPKQNIEVLSRMCELTSMGYPLLIGASRKSVIGHILDLPVDDRLEGTIATSVLAASFDFDIVRVHDVEQNVRALKVADAIVRYKNG